MAKRKPYALYGLKNSRGRIVGAFSTDYAARFEAFNLQSWSFKKKFWKQYTESWKALYRRGWRTVNGFFTEEKHDKA